MGATQFQGLYNRSRWKKMSRQQRMGAPLCETAWGTASVPPIILVPPVMAARYPC
jgi:hypothetical protein